MISINGINNQSGKERGKEKESGWERERERDCQVSKEKSLYLQSWTCWWPRSLGDCLAHRMPIETAQLDHLTEKYKKQIKEKILVIKKKPTLFSEKNNHLCSTWCEFHKPQRKVDLNTTDIFSPILWSSSSMKGWHVWDIWSPTDIQVGWCSHMFTDMQKHIHFIGWSFMYSCPFFLRV